jgi:hypothetical protein
MSDFMGTLKVSRADRSYSLQIAAKDKYKLVDEKGNAYDFPAGMLFTLFEAWVEGQKPYFCEHSGIEIK